MEITLLIMENHGKIMELCFRISVGTLKIASVYFSNLLKWWSTIESQPQNANFEDYDSCSD